MIFDDLKENYTKVSCAINQKKVFNPTQGALTEKKESDFSKWIGGLLLTSFMTGVVYFNIDDIAHASSITVKAERFYFGTFMNIAKWVIIIKGGWDVIAKTLKEDFEGAKKSVVQYLVIFAVLMGLPYALEMVEDIFSGEA